MTPAVPQTALEGGFADAPLHAAQGFRAILDAMARPGTLAELTGAAPPAPLSPAAGVAALVLLDASVPVHLAGAHDCPALRDWLTFHTGAPFVSAEEAAFAIGTWQALQPVSRFSIGTAEYPDRAATLIVELDALTVSGIPLRGPGISGAAALSLPETAAFIANRAHFPLGFDCLLTSGNRLAALPRSTVVGER